MGRRRRARAPTKSCSCTRGSARSRCGATSRVHSAQRHGWRGFVFSRYGYGRSTPKPRDERWQPDFMHRQAHEVLPALFARTRHRAALAVRPQRRRVDRAAPRRAPSDVAGVVAVAPHVFVEDISIASIAPGARRLRARPICASASRAITTTRTPRSTAGTTIWLRPGVSRLEHRGRDRRRSPARCSPCRARDDEYGTLEQVRAIARRLPKARLLVIADCGHSPHRDQPEILSREAGRFIVGEAVLS